MVAEWYYRKGEREHGPIESRALLHLAATGQLRPDDLVRKQGMKAGVPAHKVKGLSFPTPSRSALQAEAVPTPPPVRVATPAAVPQESIPVKSDVDWSSAFLLSIAFVLGAPIILAVPLLLSIFAPPALLLIPLAAVVFFFVGPKKYRSKLAAFWKTVRAPHNWRLSTTGAAASIAAGFYLAIILIGYLRNISKQDGSEIALDRSASRSRSSSMISAPKAGTPAEAATATPDATILDSVQKLGALSISLESDAKTELGKASSKSIEQFLAKVQTLNEAIAAMDANDGRKPFVVIEREQTLARGSQIYQAMASRGYKEKDIFVSYWIMSQLKTGNDASSVAGELTRARGQLARFADEGRRLLAAEAEQALVATLAERQRSPENAKAQEDVPPTPRQAASNDNQFREAVLKQVAHYVANFVDEKHKEAASVLGKTDVKDLYSELYTEIYTRLDAETVGLSGDALKEKASEVGRIWGAKKLQDMSLKAERRQL